MISGFWEKLGFWSSDLINLWKSKKDWVWFHAVSVGELNAVWPLILDINNHKSMYPIMISCTTKAGHELAKNLCKEKDFLIFYFPFDFPNIINSLLTYAKVKLLIIVETEIWPNILTECKRRDIPVVLVNARLSDKSFRNYHILKFYFKNIVNLFSEVLTQSKTDTQKFNKLGVEDKKIKTLGNIKFTTLATSSNGRNIEIEDNNSGEKFNLIFASTHPGEEEIAINTYKELLKNLPNLNIRLIIAPRHINRRNNIADIIKNYGFHPVLRSQNQKIKTSNDIFILDTIGELIYFYKISEITVLGGTFTKIGGHNILEAIRANSYTIIGPHDFKILELSNLFKKNGALVQVKNTSELILKIKEALLNKDLRESTIKKGKLIIEENANVLEQTTKRLLTYL